MPLVNKMRPVGFKVQCKFFTTDTQQTHKTAVLDQQMFIQVSILLVMMANRGYLGKSYKSIERIEYFPRTFFDSDLNLGHILKRNFFPEFQVGF